jgi:hypothetical protein
MEMPIRPTAATMPFMTSVCTGGALLARAGARRLAATNHAAFDWVVQDGPRDLWDSVARWVDAEDSRAIRYGLQSEIEPQRTASSAPHDGSTYNSFSLPEITLFTWVSSIPGDIAILLSKVNDHAIV